MKKHITTVIFLLIAAAGLTLLLYPTVSDYVTSLNHREVISDYEKSIEILDDEMYKELLDAARAFNEELAKNPNVIYLSEEQAELYEQLLNVSQVGMMGYIEIPSIDITLPIYHGSTEAVLQKNVGHIAGTSLPVGGENTHAVLSGHRGLPSAKLFTDLDKLRPGDIFIITVLKEQLAYEIDQILTVLPDEDAAFEAIKIESGQDYCTLLTCTPYGINTHRLLVRGHRTDMPKDSGTVSPAENREQAVQLNAFAVTAIAEIPIIVIASVFVLLYYIRRGRRR